MNLQLGVGLILLSLSTCLPVQEVFLFLTEIHSLFQVDVVTVIFNQTQIAESNTIPARR